MEPDGQGGATVFLDGHPQSHVDLDDPTNLAFEYVAHLAASVDALTSGPLRASHVGGAGLTLPGKDFADALFAIWLGADPGVARIKRDLLNGG